MIKFNCYNIKTSYICLASAFLKNTCTKLDFTWIFFDYINFLHNIFVNLGIKLPEKNQIKIVISIGIILSGFSTANWKIGAK